MEGGKDVGSRHNRLTCSLTHSRAKSFSRTGPPFRSDGRRRSPKPPTRTGPGPTHPSTALGSWRTVGTDRYPPGGLVLRTPTSLDSLVTGTLREKIKIFCRNNSTSSVWDFRWVSYRRSYKGLNTSDDPVKVVGLSLHVGNRPRGSRDEGRRGPILTRRNLTGQDLQSTHLVSPRHTEKHRPNKVNHTVEVPRGYSVGRGPRGRETPTQHEVTHLPGAQVGGR